MTLGTQLAGASIGILMESDFFEPEVWYYQHRFEEEGAQTHFLTRLWGQPSLTFTGHEHRVPFTVDRSFEEVSAADYDAVIVPSGMVSDRLRWTEDVTVLPPATAFLADAFAAPDTLVGIICHGLWLAAPAPQLVRGRKLTCHNNLHGDAINMGAEYVDQDVVIDGDLVTGRTGGHHHLFARALIQEIAGRRAS